jgi:hypothetical protein
MRFKYTSLLVTNNFSEEVGEVANLRQLVDFENNFQPLLINIFFLFSGGRLGNWQQYSPALTINVNIL